MSEKENLKDQFDTLFKEAGEEADVEKVVEQTGEVVDDTLAENDFEEIDFEDLNQLIQESVPESTEENPALYEEASEISDKTEETEIAETAAESAAVENKEEFFADETSEKPEKEEVYEPADTTNENSETLNGGISPDEKARLRKESRHFWLFTALVALIVIGSVLYILQRRGIIFNKDTEPSSQVVVTTPDADTSKEETTQAPEETTTEEETSEAETSTTEEETTESESSEDETTEEETTEEETSESEDESTSENESSSSGSDEVNIMDNYENIFVISGAEMVNLRADASTDSRILAKIPEFGGGEVLNPDENGWVRVSSGGYVGFVSADFVKTGEEAETLAKEHALRMVHVDSDSMNLRSGPSTDSDVLETVLYDTLWEYLGEEDGFYHIVYTSYMDGYLSKDFSTMGWYLREASSQY